VSPEKLGLLVFYSKTYFLSENTLQTLLKHQQQTYQLKKQKKKGPNHKINPDKIFHSRLIYGSYAISRLKAIIVRLPTLKISR
jgi:hypothetical protein